MKKLLYIFSFILISGLFYNSTSFSQATSYGSNATASGNLNQAVASAGQAVSRTKVTKYTAFKRLLDRIKEIFNMAKGFIYILSAFVVVLYGYDIIKNADGKKIFDYKPFLWLFIALAILASTGQIVKYAVLQGQNLESLSQEDRQFIDESLNLDGAVDWKIFQQNLIN